MPTARPVTCAVLPTPLAENPYQRLLHEALEQEGVRFLPSPKLSVRWTLSGGLPDVVHIHWLEYLIHSQRGGRRGRKLFTVGRGLRLLLTLRVLRARGVRLVWTVHNLQAHEPVVARFERFVYRRVLRRVDAAIVHSEHARQRLIETYGDPGTTLVTPHGNYLDAYPDGNGVPAGGARAALGLPESGFVALVFGVLRPYKRVPHVIDEFRALPDEHARLVVAGHVPDPDERRRIERAAHDDARVVLRLERVPDDEVPVLFAASDVAVINYAEVFSSGALMLAFSRGVPVIAPADTTAEEVAIEGAVIPIGPAGLAEALRRFHDTPPEVRGEAARATAERCTWTAMARRTVEEYRGR